ncbi:hypothetical protein B0J12DRAFT_182410 [Macrophomina phaseolina]|uniref:Dehydrin n=1 Tax=Macrophomina phaseolina TaxID=35725 RepID=A0ABQ8G4K9_9PEZI|nr:hypothetical protein B0J12DRAFT_182410 [Macrophomina phaseolina]
MPSNPAAEKDTGFASQVVNPDGAKYDEARDPGDQRYDETRYGNTGAVEPTPTRNSKGGVLEPVGGVSRSSERGQGIVGAEPSAVGPGSTSRSTAGTSHGATAADAARAAGSAAILGSGTERSFPLSGGTAKNTTTQDQQSNLGSTSHTTTGDHGTGSDYKGLAAAAAATAFAGHEHGGHGHRYDGPNTDSTNAGPTFTSGPHATETANRLDPQNSSALGSSSETTIPSPLGAAGATHARTTYDDQRAPAPHTSSTTHASGVGMPGAYPDSAAATPAYEEPTNTTDTSREHHYARDAAVAGAGAAAAGGLYEAHNKGSTETDPATFTHGPHKSNIANIVDPRVLPDPSKMKGHHAQSTETDPASKTVGPHSSNVANVLDPRVLPEPEKMKQHTTAGPHHSDTLNRVDPRVDSDLSKQTSQHHDGRDAAVAGGLSAGAAAAYAAAQHQGEKNPYTSHAVDPRVHGSTATSDVPSRTPSTKAGWFAGPTGSAVDPSKDLSATSAGNAGSTGFGGPGATQSPQQHNHGHDAAVAGGLGFSGAGAGHAYEQHKADKAAEHYPATTAAQQQTSTSSTEPSGQHHYGRDAALAGGAGLVGTGAAYDYQKREAEKAEREHPYGTTTPVSGATGTRTRASGDPTRISGEASKHHYGRGAAAVGAVGAAGAGAYEFSKHDAEKADKERLKEAATAEKEHLKEADQDAKAHQKELEKEEKKHLKEVEKEEKKHQKELEKEEKKHQKELEKEEKKKHGGGLLGFLHRDKDKDKVKGEEKVVDPTTTADKRHRTDGRTGQAGAVSGLQGVRAGEPRAVQPGEKEGVVVEPHTGLPMNVGKYGSGAGGTDGNETIHGLHGHGPGTDEPGVNLASQGSAQGGNIGTDWQGIKKANTPY